METFLLKRANKHFFVSARSNQRVDKIGIKMSQKDSPVVVDGCVKNEEAEVDRLAIMKYFRDNEKKRVKMAGSLPFCYFISAKFVMGYPCGCNN